jgi:hypothetical protein
MSVIIKNMQMPHICMSCEFCGYIDNRYSFCTRLPMRGEVSIGEPRPEWCPLVEVPAHGRLIDGDELSDGCDEPYWCRWKSEIDDAPTIIPAEEDESG